MEKSTVPSVAEAIAAMICPGRLCLFRGSNGLRKGRLGGIARDIPRRRWRVPWAETDEDRVDPRWVEQRGRQREVQARSFDRALDEFNPSAYRLSAGRRLWRERLQ